MSLTIDAEMNGARRRWANHFGRLEDIDRITKEKTKMSKNKVVVPEAQAALDRFKMEAAAEVGVNLKNGYNGDLTSRQAGSVGGQMVKKMIQSYENSLKTNG